jgi:hypothetical protein
MVVADPSACVVPAGRPKKNGSGNRTPRCTKLPIHPSLVDPLHALIHFALASRLRSQCFGPSVSSNQPNVSTNLDRKAALFGRPVYPSDT